MKIRFITNDTGFAQEPELEAGTTLEQFVASQGINPADYTIRVNRQEQLGNFTLEEGMMVSFSPKKIKSA
jgi:hypothetical protein